MSGAYGEEKGAILIQVILLHTAVLSYSYAPFYCTYLKEQLQNNGESLSSNITLLITQRVSPETDCSRDEIQLLVFEIL